MRAGKPPQTISHPGALSLAILYSIPRREELQLIRHFVACRLLDPFWRYSWSKCKVIHNHVHCWLWMGQNETTKLCGYWTHVHQILFLGTCWYISSKIFDISIRSKHICDQSLKLSKIAPNWYLTYIWTSLFAKTGSKTDRGQTTYTRKRSTHNNKITKMHTAVYTVKH